MTNINYLVFIWNVFVDTLLLVIVYAWKMYDMQTLHAGGIPMFRGTYLVDPCVYTNVQGGGGGFLFWVMFILLITYKNIVEITYCSFTSSAFGFTISDNNNFAYLSSVELSMSRYSRLCTELVDNKSMLPTHIQYTPMLKYPGCFSFL